MSKLLKLVKKAQWFIPLVAAILAVMSFSMTAFAESTQSCVANQGARVRSGPGMKYKIVGGLQKGQSVEVDETNDDNTWLHHPKGWTAATLLDCDSSNADTNDENGTPSSSANSNWDIKWLKGATAQMRGNGSNPWAVFPKLNPPAWPEFPNVDNDAENFPAAWGLEFGEDESQFCGSTGDQCEIVVPPGSYALISGYWELDGLGKCNASSLVKGCSLMIINVGEVSAEFTGTLDNVYAIQGRYWHGDHLPQAIVAGLSHVDWNMSNGTSKLNPKGSVNAGGNCSVKKGCESIDTQFKVTSGGELLIDGQTTYTRSK